MEENRIRPSVKHKYIEERVPRWYPCNGADPTDLEDDEWTIASGISKATAANLSAARGAFVDAVIAALEYDGDAFTAFCDAQGKRRRELDPSPAEVAELLRAVEWSNAYADEEGCPDCGARKPGPHQDLCKLAAMLRRCEGV